MAKPENISLFINRTILGQAERLAQQLNVSQSQLFEMALSSFLETYESPSHIDAIEPMHDPQPTTREPRIHQGDLYWAKLDSAGDVVPSVLHPYVIIQDDLLNHSRIQTVVACALTSNIRRVSETPGNVLLDDGEANLPKRSVVEVSKVTTLEKAQLGDYIGTLDERRVAQILAGMRFLQMTVFTR